MSTTPPDHAVVEHEGLQVVAFMIVKVMETLPRSRETPVNAVDPLL